MSPADAAKPVEQKLIDDVREYGWHCVKVVADEEHEEFAYTVGLFHTYRHPELLIYGLPHEIAHRILGIAADAVARGEPLNLEAPTTDLICDYSCVFVQVPLTEYPEHVGFARWFYEGDNFPVYQVVWPSKSGYFPWHPEATDAFRAKQPVLGQHE